MGSPRILLWDCETSHNLTAVFQLRQQDYIPSENIIQERFIICASWKELGKHSIHSVSILQDPKRFAADPFDDHHVVKTLHSVLSGADALIAHNGDSFDLKFAEARMLVHGLPPLPPITSIDTLKVARNRFLFNANNLNYLGNLLGVGHKKPTKTGLWLKVLQGDKQAIRDMVAYNRQDIVLLEKVFLKLQPWIATHVNRQLYGGTGCPRCGSMNLQARGTHKALTRTYQRYQCQTCGGWHRTLKATTLSTPMRVI